MFGRVTPLPRLQSGAEGALSQDVGGASLGEGGACWGSHLACGHPAPLSWPCRARGACRERAAEAGSGAAGRWVLRGGPGDPCPVAGVGTASGGVPCSGAGGLVVSPVLGAVGVSGVACEGEPGGGGSVASPVRGGGGPVVFLMGGGCGWSVRGVCGGPYRGAGEAQCFPCGRHWGGSVMSPRSSTCVGISRVPQSSPAAQPCPLWLCWAGIGTVRSEGAGPWQCLPEQRCAQPLPGQPCRLQRWRGRCFTPWQCWGPAM